MDFGRKKKRPGVFRNALRGRAAVIQVLLDIGMSWAEIASHFAEDRWLGGASREHFMSEWSRLKKEGLAFSPSELELVRGSLSGADGSRWQIVK